MALDEPAEDEIGHLESELLANVPTDGSGIGNSTLMRKLKWALGQYLMVRDRLIERGILRRRPGRGGAVGRVEVENHELPAAPSTATAPRHEEEEADIDAPCDTPQVPGGVDQLLSRWHDALMSTSETASVRAAQASVHTPHTERAPRRPEREGRTSTSEHPEDLVDVPRVETARDWHSERMRYCVVARWDRGSAEIEVPDFDVSYVYAATTSRASRLLKNRKHDRHALNLLI